MSKYSPTESELDFARESRPITSRSVSHKQESTYSPTSEEMDFARASMDAPTYQDISRFKSLVNAAGRGLIRFGADTRDLIAESMKPSAFEEGDKEIGKIYGFDSLTADEKQTPQPMDEFEKGQLDQELENKLPIKEGLPERIVERTTRIAPNALLGPGGIVGKGIRTLAAAGLGQATEEAGFGPGAQTIAEILAFAAPNLNRRLVGSTPREQELINFGRARGMTEQQLVPAVKEQNWWRRSLARIANKGERTQEALEDSREALGQIYDSLRNSPGATQPLPRNNVRQVFTDYAQELHNLPESVRRQIRPSLRDLVNSPGLGEDFIQFYQHVNHEVNNHRIIGRFQEVTRRALEHISPELGEEFRLVNELASNRYRTARMLRPPAQPNVLPIVKGAAAIWGVLSGDYRMLKGVLKFVGAQQVATAMLMNPRYQSLGVKTVHALNNNNIILAQKSFQELREALKEEAPDFYKETKDFDIETIRPEQKEKPSKQSKTK